MSEQHMCQCSHHPLDHLSDDPDERITQLQEAILLGSQMLAMPDLVLLEKSIELMVTDGEPRSPVFRQACAAPEYLDTLRMTLRRMITELRGMQLETIQRMSGDSVLYTSD